MTASGEIGSVVPTNDTEALGPPASLAFEIVR